jgi:hemolysin activation/secretion protein
MHHFLHYQQGIALNHDLYPYRKVWPLWLAASFCWTALGAQAQIDAGSLQQQIDRNQVMRLPRLMAPAPGPAPRAERATGGPQVTLGRFIIRGRTLIPESELQKALAGYLGRPLSFSDLEDAAAEVGQRFREQGWVVRVFFPEQDIVQGVATMEVIEATLGEIKSDGEVAKPSDLNSLRQIIGASQSPNGFLNNNKLDRGLLIANDISGVNVAGNLMEGEAQAQTDLILKTTSKPFVDGNLSLDNTGSYGTGPIRAAALINLNNLLTPGGALNTQIAQTEGSKYGRLGLSQPIGHEGWRWSLSASRLDYKVVNLPVEVRGSGNSNIYGAELTYPMVRARNRNLYLSMTADEKQFKNYDPLGLLASNYSSRVYSVGLQGNRETDWVGLNGALSGYLTASSGFLDLSGSPNEDTQAKDANPAGHFSKLRWMLSQEQSLNSSFSLYGSFSGQWANKNLDSSEKFTLGGPSGVRAYGTGEAAGSRGRTLNLELRWRWSPTLSFSGFHDVGWIRTNVSNSYPGAPVLNHYGLRGSGLAVNWLTLDSLSFRAVWARRAGANPKPNDVTGRDQDGNLVINRIWLTVTSPF